ncbi:MAG: HNH endonuclease [Intrasporangiaceae bacterium]|nr:HNH endonuclease [Intrasporangiaceae bacterium]
MPTHQAAAIWSAATSLAKEYQGLHPELTLDQARLDAFVDLALANVTVTTHVTLGIPMVTSAYARTGEAPTDLLDEPAGIDGTDPSYHCDTEHDPDRDPPEDPWTTEGAEGAEGGEGAEGADSEGADQRRCDVQPPARDFGAETGCRGHSRAVDEDNTTCPPGERDRGYRGPGAAPLRVPAWAAHPDGPPLACIGERERAWWLSGVHLPGLGYVPPDIVQALTAQLGTRISVALLDAHRGTLLSHATDAYRPTKAISALVATRDGQCRFFGCTRPATGCDLDHAIAHHRHGPTSGQNLATLCRRHHRAKQRREWTYLLDPDSGVAWWINSRTGSMRTTLPAVPAGSTPESTTYRPSDRSDASLS